MPIYEFDCGRCGEPFEELVRNAEAVEEVVCPACGSPKVRKKLSVFSSKVAGQAAPAACAPGGT